MKVFPGFPALFVALFAAPVLFACAPAPREAPRPGTVDPPKVAPFAAPPTEAPGGLTEREPDTCKATGLQGLVGQPSGMARTVRAPGPMRIISEGTVYDQEEYRSERINLFVDRDGIIRRVSCG